MSGNIYSSDETSGIGFLFLFLECCNSSVNLNKMFYDENKEHLIGKFPIQGYDGFRINLLYFIFLVGCVNHKS